jgi:predicted MPP superfamily phosphohydrolase
VPPLSRRSFLQTFTAATFALGPGTAAYSAGWERRRPILNRTQLPCPHLKESQRGITILHLSDLHVDDWTPTIALERAAQLAHETQPDLIVLTGDFITSRADKLLPATQALRSLKAPLGIFACLGNHDVWHGSRRIASDLQQLGIRTLINESVCLQAPGGPLWITGFDSAWAGQPNPKSALRHWNPSEPNILLLHEPDAADHLAAQNLAAVQLAGHTHGGQVRAPFIGAIETPYLGHKYILGYHRVGDIHLHVNPGLGTMGVPFRFLCPPELTLHTLVPA